MRAFARNAATIWRARGFRKSRLRKPFRTSAFSIRRLAKERRRITKSWANASSRSKKQTNCRGIAFFIWRCRRKFSPSRLRRWARWAEQKQGLDAAGDREAVWARFGVGARAQPGGA